MPSDSSDILVVEPRWEGAFHVPFNAAVLEVVRAGWPAAAVTFAANSDHLERVRGTLPTPVRDAVRFVALDAGPSNEAWQSYRWWARRDLHPLREAWRGLGLFERLADGGRDERRWLVTSADASALNALSLGRRLGRLPRRIEVVVHGELSNVVGWRSRRPLRRWLDLRSALRRWTRGGSLTVLEGHVREALVAEFPWMDAPGRLRVLPHPVPTAADRSGAGDRAPGSAAAPLQIGFLGVATRAKGIDVYAELATRFRDDADVRFRVAGFLPEPLPDVDLEVLADPLSRDAMPRAEYDGVVRDLDFVCLPLAGDYYRFAASGTVLDAVSKLRPLLTLESPLTRHLFEEAGDIGYLCADVGELEATIRRLAASPDPGRYRRQVAGLARFAGRRTPEALARAMGDRWWVDRPGDRPA